MHASTWRALPDREERRGWPHKPIRHPRVSVMVHVHAVTEGDEVIYTGESGFDRIATVVEVRPCWAPRDMFKLILENFRVLQPAPMEGVDA